MDEMLLTLDDIKDWPVTPHGAKIACPDCGQTGYPCEGKRTWIQKHRWHEPCSICGKVYPRATLKMHEQRAHAQGR